MTTYGYARCSTQEQSLDVQLSALKEAGATQIFREKISGQHASNRPELNKLLSVAKAGDTVIVLKLDRLGRSTTDLLHILDDFKQRGIGFKSLKENWDTTSPQGILLATMLAAISQFERSLIQERMELGRQHALKNGTRSGKPFGRPKWGTPFQRREAWARKQAGKESLRDIAASYGISPSMISRLRDPNGDAT
jgi:DNA invertase Pin-like site-specific DNA recombinase